MSVLDLISGSIQPSFSINLIQAIVISNGVNHSTFRGNEKKAAFKDDQDRINVLNTLQR